MEEAHLKRCPACDQFKGRMFFGNNKATRDGLSCFCLSCKCRKQRDLNEREPETKRLSDRKWRTENREHKNATDRKRYHADKSVFRERNLRALYGITLAQYEVMLESQGGGCAVCRKTQEENKGRHFFVDHCHDSGRIRALLCYNCNSALGMAGDNVERLEKLIAYLRHHASLE